LYYYFHSTHRCVTCKAVGRVSRELVEDKYGGNNNVEFIRIRDEIKRDFTEFYRNLNKLK
jgi:hypothetical protein